MKCKLIKKRTTKFRTPQNDEQSFARMRRSESSTAARRAVATARTNNSYERAFNYVPAVHYTDNSKVSEFILAQYLLNA